MQTLAACKQAPIAVGINKLTVFEFHPQVATDFVNGGVAYYMSKHAGGHRIITGRCGYNEQAFQDALMQSFSV